MKYLDAHAHIQFPPYDTDREEVIQQMNEAGVGGLIVGCDLVSSKAAVELVQERENFFAAVGLHPNREEDEWFEVENYRPFLKDPKVVAIGECGLDYYRPETIDAELKRKQKNLFQDHIDLACESGKPLIIHARPSKGTMDAYEHAIEMLIRAKEKYPELRGDFHFFVGNIETAKKIVALDFTLSYTAVLTFTRDYDEVVRSIPLTHMIAETDSPYVAPATRRGQRNDPLAVIDVVSAIASIRGEEPEAVREAILENSKRLLSI